MGRHFHLTHQKLVYGNVQGKPRRIKNSIPYSEHVYILRPKEICCVEVLLDLAVENILHQKWEPANLVSKQQHE